MNDHKAMTARELLEALRALTEAELDLAVRMEGCDCYGDLANLEVREYEGEPGTRRVMLRRTNGMRNHG